MDKGLSEEERQERIEHQDVLLAIRAILNTTSGYAFFKYLFKHLEVTGLPELGLDDKLLYDRLGSLRPGREIFKLVSEADAKKSSEILAQLEKERYEKLYAEYYNG